MFYVNYKVNEDEPALKIIYQAVNIYMFTKLLNNKHITKLKLNIISKFIYCAFIFDNLITSRISITYYINSKI